MESLFCDNEECDHHVMCNLEILNHGLRIEIPGSHKIRELKRYPYRVFYGPEGKIKVLWFCEICKAAIDMCEINNQKKV